MCCDACGKSEDIYRTIKNIDYNLPSCCDQTMRRKITAPYVSVDIQPYKSMISGEMITSRSQHREHLKQHGMIEIGNEKMPAPKPMNTEVPGLKEELYARLSG